MANTLNGTARGAHVSPGVYTRETEITYATKSLGITTLGLAGETVKGPAFQPMLVSNWREYQNLFGGTNPEKFKGSQYPKYELPYIAKSYLTQSQQLYVCRVLGLSGYNAGPAWAITMKYGEGKSVGSKDKMVVAVVRSRGKYSKYFKYDNDNTTSGSCECQNRSYDVLQYSVGEKTWTNCVKPKDYNMNALQIGEYIPLEDNGNECTTYNTNSGSASFDVSQSNHGRLKLFGWTGMHSSDEINGFISSEATEESASTISSEGTKDSTYFEYAVTFNPNDRDYILKVLGSSADDGDAPIYVESLYDVAIDQQLAEDKIIKIVPKLSSYQVYYSTDYCDVEPVYGFLTVPEESLSRKNVGQRYLADAAAVANKIQCHLYDYNSNKPISSDTVVAGQIYTVVQYTDKDNKRHFYYRWYYSKSLSKTPLMKDTVIGELTNTWQPSVSGDSGLTMLASGGTDVIPLIDRIALPEEMVSGVTGPTTADSNYSSVSATWMSTSAFTNQMISNKRALVKNNADGHYYRMASGNGGYDVYKVEVDMNNYKSSYRYASTPWIVSNVKGDYKHIELNKLFRFHTISDGNSSNYQVKVSVLNIRPDEGLFDVYVRDINDSDTSIVPLEKFTKCSLVPGTSNYLGLKIGTFDGSYESKSQYITVEINENTVTENAVPAGFLGYPRHLYGGLPVIGSGSTDIDGPVLKYNCDFDTEVKHKRQYFGLSDSVGVDIDAFTFKGNASYYDSPEYMTQGFHLDSRMDMTAYGAVESAQPIVTVDGEEGYKFDSVSINTRTSLLSDQPVIDKEVEMEGSIFEYLDLRKFTVYFYGGFDGWDVFRDERSITDDFKKTKYRGTYSDISGDGLAIDKIADPESLGLNQEGITSDWYAYLSAIRQFANPQAIDINVFSTPGIDYVNNQLLVEEAIEMIEEERGDALYVVTTPDKPSGAYDYVSEMFTPDDAVSNLEDTEIVSNYVCTYYPWCKYYDSDNNMYVMLPPTRDIVRNIAMTDNISFPWFAPAGIDRGDVLCTKAHFMTKLADEDVLYEGRINPIKTFGGGEGVKIWGQKTLSDNSDSALNRINIRRLLLRVKKLITSACNKLIFDQNDTTAKNKFLSAVTPILDTIKSNRGLYDYKIEVDDSVEARERLELPSKIFLKPTKALEYIPIDFIITPENVSFENI